MFKRLTKFNNQREKDAARGIDISQDAPPEVMMDEESGSESESDSEQEDSEDESDDDDEQESRGQKRKAGDDDEDDEDAGSDSDAASDASDSSYDDTIPPISISQSLQSPFYISPLTQHKAGEPWTTCLVCPLAQLKSSTAVEVHMGSKAHKRRFERYVKYVDERLSEVEKVSDFEAGGADPRGVVKEIEGEVERRRAGGEKGKTAPAQVKSQAISTSDKAQARRERKKANKKAWKLAKEERKRSRVGEGQAVGEDVGDDAKVDAVREKKPKKAKTTTA